MVISTYGTRRRRTERGGTIRLDRCAISIADGRHVEHDAVEAGEAEAIDESRRWKRSRELRNVKRSFRSNASPNVNAPYGNLKKITAHLDREVAREDGVVFRSVDIPGLLSMRLF